MTDDNKRRIEALSVPVIDDELHRIGSIHGILDPLSQNDIDRILRYLLSRYQAKGDGNGA